MTPAPFPMHFKIARDLTPAERQRQIAAAIDAVLSRCERNLEASLADEPIEVVTFVLAEFYRTAPDWRALVLQRLYAADVDVTDTDPVAGLA